MTQFSKFFEQKRVETRNQRKAVTAALAEGPLTVAELVNKTGLSPTCIVWNLIAMLKWSQVEVRGQKSDELVYALKEVQ